MTQTLDQTWMTTDETAAYVRLSKGHLLLLCKHGKIPFARLAKNSLRFNREELDAWMRAGGCHPEPTN
jgi:excisionase family DNA binding protein